MIAKIASVARSKGITTITINGNNISYNKDEYEKFRQAVLSIVKITDLNCLKDLTFEWETKDKPYPVAIVTPNNPIFVDVLEPDTIFEKLLPLSARLPLDVGDYRFKGWVNGQYDDVLIERKEANDLVGSVMSGHLSDQVNRMAAVGAKAIILLKEDYLGCSIDGRARTRAMHYKVTFDFIWNHLHTLQQENGLIIEDSPYQRYTPKRIKDIYDRYQEREHKSNKVLKSFSTNLKGPKRVLSSFPGYGEVVIDNVARRFSTLREYFGADVKVRQSTENVGSTLAKRIDEILDAKFEEEK